MQQNPSDAPTSAPVALEAPTGEGAGTEVVEEFWPGGQIRLRKQVEVEPDGSKVDHGRYTVWYPNGQKRYQSTYDHGMLEGVERQWHPNGQKQTEQQYHAGLRHGVRYDWDNQGRLLKEEHYFEDKPDGTWTVWDKQGRLKWQAQFDKGRVLSGDS